MMNHPAIGDFGGFLGYPHALEASESWPIQPTRLGPFEKRKRSEPFWMAREELAVLDLTFFLGS